jgi:hypothetical protein
MSHLICETLALGRPHPSSSLGGGGEMPSFAWVGIAAGVVVPIVIVVLVFGRIFRGMADHKALLQTGVRANARITDIRQTGTTLNNQPGCAIGLLITPTGGGQPYAATVTQFVSLVELPRLMPGAELTVRVDPKNRAHVAIEAFGPSPTMTAPEANELAMKNQRVLQEVNANGVAADAVILSFTLTGVEVNSAGPLATVTLKVMPAGEAPFDASLTAPFTRSGLHKYQAGKQVHVKYDPNDRSRVHFDLAKLPQDPSPG